MTKSMMDKWSTQTDKVFFSSNQAGEKIKDAIIKTPLTIDDIASLAETAGRLALYGFSAAYILRKRVAALRGIGIIKEE